MQQLLVQIVKRPVLHFLYPRSEVGGGDILESPCPSVRQSVRLFVDARLGKTVSSALLLPLYSYHETAHAVSP